MDSSLHTILEFVPVLVSILHPGPEYKLRSSRMLEKNKRIIYQTSNRGVWEVRFERENVVFVKKTVIHL
jgi:hypothetical protein